MNKEVTGADISHPISANATTQLKQIRKNLPLRVLSEEDWNHWITRGYVIVRSAISREAAKRLEEVLWEFDDKDPNDPSTWYEPERRPHVRPELNNVGMTEIYHHQYMWDNRMAQRVYDAFVEFGTEKTSGSLLIEPTLTRQKKSKGSQMASSIGMLI